MVKKDKIKNLFTGTVRRDKYKWLLPISAHLIRALNIQENSKYDIGVDADQNKIIFKFRKKPIGFLGYRLNLIDEFKKVDKPLMEKEIDKNIENSKKVLSDKPLKYLYTDTDNQAEIKNLKQCIKWCKRRLTFLNTLEEGKQLYKEEYQKKKLSKLKNKQL
jgi:hypothetical protein